MDLKFNINCNILIYIILFINLYEIGSSISLNYPSSVCLPNGKIFIIRETGITIYDHLLTTKIKDILTFPSNETITENDLSRITTTFSEDDNIFSVIKDKIYIFDNKGNLLFHNNTSILKKGVEPKYYSLNVVKKKDNLYRFAIHYKVEYDFYRNYYNYNKTSNETISNGSYSDDSIYYYSESYNTQYSGYLYYDKSDH